MQEDQPKEDKPDSALTVVVRFRPLNRPEREYNEAHKNGSNQTEGANLIVTGDTIRDDKRNKVFSRFDSILMEESTQVCAITITHRLSARPLATPLVEHLPEHPPRQEQLYWNSSKKLVGDVCEGINTGLFAYGQVWHAILALPPMPVCVLYSLAAASRSR